ncbi:MAG: MFS transporter [Promethearchaeota archaeon]
MIRITRRFNPKLIVISFSLPFFSIRILESLLSAILYSILFSYGVPFQVVSIFYIGIRILVIAILPLLGYFSDRNYFLTKRLGRRFLPVISSGLLLSFIFIIASLPFYFNIFNLPYYLLLIFLFYLIYSFYTMNYSALLISKFRVFKERLVITGLTEFLSTLGFILFFLYLPFLFNDFVILLFIAAGVFFITILVGIPGLIEEKDLINTYFSPNHQPQEWFFKDFFKRFSITFRQKNFLLLLIRWIATAFFNFFFLAFLPLYFLRSFNASAFTILILLGTYNICLIIAIPLSIILSRFHRYLKIWIISGFGLGLGIVIFPLLAVSLISAQIMMGILGFIFGLGSVPSIPIVGDVFDESTVINRKRSDGFFFGILNFFSGNIFLLSRSPSIINVPLLTYLESIVLTCIIPGAILIISMIVFVVLYDLNPQKVRVVQEKLQELQL